MFIKKIALATLVWWLVSISSSAQNHNNVWFRGTLSTLLKEKIRLDAELQHRRQNGIGDQLAFDKNLMYSLRTWVHYQHKKHLKISVSPFAYFRNYKVIEQPVDEKQKPVNEFRFSVAAELQYILYKKLFLVERPALEVRFLNHSAANIVRVRNLLGLRYEFSNKTKIFAFEESAVNVSGAGEGHIFDHCRLGIHFEYQFASHWKATLGYLYINRLLLNSDERIREHNPFLNIAYILVKK